MVGNPLDPDFPERFHAQFGERKADAVTMHNFIGSPGAGSTQHLGEAEARKILRNAHEILAPEGVCVIEPPIEYEPTPDIFLHTWGLPPRHKFPDLGFDVVRYGMHRGQMADKEFKDSDFSGQLIILLKKR